MKLAHARREVLGALDILVKFLYEAFYSVLSRCFNFDRWLHHFLLLLKNLERLIKELLGLLWVEEKVCDVAGSLVTAELVHLLDIVLDSKVVYLSNEVEPYYSPEDVYCDNDLVVLESPRNQPLFAPFRGGLVLHAESIDIVVDLFEKLMELFDVIYLATGE